MVNKISIDVYFWVLQKENKHYDSYWCPVRESSEFWKLQRFSSTRLSKTLLTRKNLYCKLKACLHDQICRHHFSGSYPYFLSVQLRSIEQVDDNVFWNDCIRGARMLYLPNGSTTVSFCKQVQEIKDAFLHGCDDTMPLQSLPSR